MLKLKFGKLLVISSVVLFLLSLLVFAQNFDDKRFSDDRFRGEFHDEGDSRDVRSDFRDESDRRERRDGDEIYEFRERGDFEPDFGPEYKNLEEMLFGRLFGLFG